MLDQFLQMAVYAHQHGISIAALRLTLTKNGEMNEEEIDLLCELVILEVRSIKRNKSGDCINATIY